MKKMIQQLKQEAPARGYLQAHRDVQDPFPILGGPIEVQIRQTSGGVHVALPARRELDPAVFGNPDRPRMMTGTPSIYGVPTMMRTTNDGQYGEFTHMSPFGNEVKVWPNGNLKIQATDATATDAATTNDEVKFVASWEGPEGNTYEVRCCAQLAAHGMEYPTFGGVVTNHILHGFTGIGTALMLSEYTYFAFWGMGEVRKNGETLARPRLIHGMLTEYVRTEGYELAFDHEVEPTRRHFHLMVPPMMPDMENCTFTQSPVKTGFTLPNGKPLPFWHVMFQNLEIDASR